MAGEAQAKRLQLRNVEDWLEDRIVAIWTNLLTNNLWQRMLKNTVATTITVILALIPAVVSVYGKAIYLGPITTVFGHPGRRFGMMAEALILAISGTLLGIGWSAFGIYLSSLVHEQNAPAGYTIRGIFLAVALMFHGFLRSHTPRLFLFVLLLIIVSVVSLTGTSTQVTISLVTTLLYPIATAVGVLLLVNLVIFPEFSSTFLGITTIETLGETTKALRDAGIYFISFAEAQQETENGNEGVAEPELASVNVKGDAVMENSSMEFARPPLFSRILGRVYPEAAKQSDTSQVIYVSQPKVKLASLSGVKPKLRARLAGCKAAQTECNFELAYAVLPPADLKPISDTAMKKIVANTIALIGACESKYALMGDDEDAVEHNLAAKDQLKRDAERANVELPESEDSEKDDSGNDNAPKKGKQKAEDGSRKKSLWGSIFAPSSDDESEREGNKERRRRKRDLSRDRAKKELEDIELVKPRKEIEFGDIDLLRYLVKHISKPLRDLQLKVDESVNAISACLAYCYDVNKLPSGARPPKGVTVEELDIRIEILADAIVEFDKNTAAALEAAAALHDVQGPQLDIMPRMETFLVSSFLLNLRQAALHTKEMILHSRDLVEKRQERRESRRMWFPNIKWKKWLTSGGELDEFSLPEQGRKYARTGGIAHAEAVPSHNTSDETLVRRTTSDEEGAHSPIDTGAVPPGNEKIWTEKSANKQKPPSIRLRSSLADFVEYMLESEDVLYAIKLTFAVFLVSWPAFVWNSWFSLNRGLWAALQLVLITEVAIGTSVMTFLLRAVGTSIGCLWGWAAYSAGNGNPYVVVVMLVIGIIPSTYIQLGSKYVKAGMVTIISMCIVAIATEVQTVPGTATENFLKRFIAFLIGGVVALLVEVVILPVRARDRLVESLAATINQISDMEACLAYGIEAEVNVNVQSTAVSERFDSAKAKAQGALVAAETFLPFCSQEPRLKGSFRALALVYAEILYVLHQIIDKMDNMLQLRKAYGSGVLEELNSQVYPYRRNVAGSITLVLFAVHEALTTKLPLPQFLPSARLAHLRMVNRVREVVLSDGDALGKRAEEREGRERRRSHMEVHLVKRVLRQKFLSWNAASAGQIEVIEYLEELIDLTKLLVGANEFRTGMLTRMTYREYVERIGAQDREAFNPDEKSGGRRDSNLEREREELRDTVPDSVSHPPPKVLGVTRRKTGPASGAENPTTDAALQKITTVDSRRSENEESLPLSLQRVRTRRLEQVRSGESESWTSGRETRRIWMTH